MRASLLLVFLLASCGLRVQRPVDGPGNCTTATENMRRLGGCGQDMTDFESNCNDAERAERSLGVKLPTGCLTAATDCEEASLCE